MRDRTRSRYCAERFAFGADRSPIAALSVGTRNGEPRTGHAERSTVLLERQGNNASLLEATIAARLGRAGVALPAGDVAAIAEEALAEAVRLSLAWLERE